MKDIDKLAIRDVSGGCVIAVKAVPGSSRDKVAGVLGDALKIATSAPPEKGKANAALGRILAKTLGVQAGAVSLAGGGTNPLKEFHIANLSADQVRAKLGAL